MVLQSPVFGVFGPQNPKPLRKEPKKCDILPAGHEIQVHIADKPFSYTF